MRHASLPFLALFALPLLACGGTVVTPDPSGSGGSGATGSSSSSSSNTTTSSSTGPDPIDAGMTKEPIYTAYNLFTHVPRFVVFKADWTRNVCIRLMVEGIGAGGIGIQSPSGWGVAMAEITNRASDCVLENGYPAPPGDAAVTAASGAGTLTMKGTFPCEVSVHATLNFPAGSPAWVNPTEDFDVDALPVDGGCG